VSFFYRTGFESSISRAILKISAILLFCYETTKPS
jgi:hypothetical protein